MGKYQGYEKYKDSGVEWLGEIPEHWKISRAKFVSEIFVPQRNKPELNLDDGLPWLTMDDMLGDRVSQTKFKVTKEASINAGSKSLKKGSVIASCIGNFGVCTINDVDVIINQQLQAFIPNSHIIPEYLRELVKISSDYFQMIATAATVIYVNQAGFANMPITLPSLDEQEKIARFLDHKTKQIDDLIAKKEALIEKLDEKRTALISHAVTKGLDPSVLMKDSGVEWLGAIPEHWNILPLRRLMNGTTQNGLYKSKEFFNESGTPFIQMGEAFAEPIISKTAKDRISINSTELEQWGLKEGDLIFARRSLVFEGSGKCSIVGDLAEKHVYESSMIRVRLNTEILNPLFAFFYFGSPFSRGQILSTTNRVTISGIDSQQLKSLTFVLPPIIEQEKIIKFIEIINQIHQKSTDKIQQAIDRLKEYRTALITNAVTGKIDVRQVPIP